MPRAAARSIAMPAACAVPITVRTLCWENTRSTATASGACASSSASIPARMAVSRRSTGSAGSVRSTPTSTSRALRSAAASTTP